MKRKTTEILQEIYDRLFAFFGPQNWWPAETPFEVCVGAILTQNATWKNVEKAINNLKQKGFLNPQALYELSLDKLAELIKPSGFYNLKAKRLKTFVEFLVVNYQGDLNLMFQQPLPKIREELLNLKGLGKETVDSILLYAGNLPVFVVDAYTYRILNRHLLISEEANYDEIQAFFMENLPLDPALFNEYHALLVACGKTFCKKVTPVCDPCPLKGI
ncbi:endonuclease III domain-containing protein [Thermodesulfobacterium sp. TA1]|uniref:endonuclease III domain-containing protein n=1 Tax=Thermodesulfobacterium sp. TA1 TaxID=2234087 RepID=UPI00197EB933|nr:endonuclease III domain-containing protein [Thermodesulfobacterium sp. TA1]